MINMNPFFRIRNFIKKIENSVDNWILSKLKRCILCNVCRLYLLDGSCTKDETFY